VPGFLELEMIYIVEIPSQRKPSAWAALNENDFCNKVAESQRRSGDNIYDAGTVRQIAANSGADLTNEDDMTECGYGGLVAKFGLDTPIFRGYCQAEWTAIDPGRFAQYVDANGHDLHTQHIFMSAEEAVAALDDGSIKGHGAWTAVDALRALLVRDGALEEAASEDECDE
jgi:hypothetical protein